MSSPDNASASNVVEFDAYDAVLHHIYNQVYGKVWFVPTEEQAAGGVCVRIANPVGQTPYSDPLPSRRQSIGDILFRTYPYDKDYLIPFENAVRLLNPVVAVKLRTAAIHSALSTIGEFDDAIYIDNNTRIQVLDSITLLPEAEREQRGAFIRDESVLVVWADDLEGIIPLVRDFEQKLIKLVWQSRPATTKIHSSTILGISGPTFHLTPTPDQSEGGGSQTGGSQTALAEKADAKGSSDVIPEILREPAEEGAKAQPPKKQKRRLGWRRTKKQADADAAAEAAADEKAADGEDVEGGELGIAKPRKIALFAAVYAGIACGMSLLFIGIGINILVGEMLLDGTFIRFALLVFAPLSFCVALFFCQQLIGNVSYIFGPVAQFHENTKYYSAIKPKMNRRVDRNLPHITIQMPVYKESLKETIAPSVDSLKRAMQTYARQGGTSSIFVNEDGLQLLSEKDRSERIQFYANHGIGWIARPPHTNKDPEGFHRAGRFKKASNMNYGLLMSLRMERCLMELKQGIVKPVATPGTPPENNPFTIESDEEKRESSPVPATPGDETPAEGEKPNTVKFGAVRTVDYAASERDMEDVREEDLEAQALQMAMDETWDLSERKPKCRPWASIGQARACRVGELILIVDSDTVVPEDCFRDAAREFGESPSVAIIQHESDVRQVAHHYFENGIAWFTRRINRCISMACANGEVAPFVGHNAFLRWSALQDAAFVDSRDGQTKIWSESNVSEDFDMALRLLMKGYDIRWASYSNGGFKEGVSLTCDDELNRWQKYAYGCNELLFNPIVQWWRRGPISKMIHTFIWSNAPVHYKLSMLSYMFSYYGLAAGFTLSVVNYVLLGLQFPIDGYYEHSFEIWLACMVVFIGAGNVGFSLLEYRLGLRNFLTSLLECLAWAPFFFFFFGGLSIHLAQALLAHLFSYNITWGATKKEVERSNFFLEVPKILRRFWLSFVASIVLIAGMIILSTNLVPPEWRVDVTDWAVILPFCLTIGCHFLYPIVLNPWLMIFSY